MRANSPSLPWERGELANRFHELDDIPAYGMLRVLVNERSPPVCGFRYGSTATYELVTDRIREPPLNVIRCDAHLTVCSIEHDLDSLARVSQCLTQIQEIAGILERPDLRRDEKENLIGVIEDREHSLVITNRAVNDSIV